MLKKCKGQFIPNVGEGQGAMDINVKVKYMFL